VRQGEVNINLLLDAVNDLDASESKWTAVTDIEG
jgi:hypothetical protein